MTGTIENLNIAPQIKRLAAFALATAAIVGAPLLTTPDLTRSLAPAVSPAAIAHSEAAPLKRSVAAAERIVGVWELYERTSVDLARVPARAARSTPILIASR